jgi:hypothetical protein
MVDAGGGPGGGPKVHTCTALNRRDSLKGQGCRKLP